MEVREVRSVSCECKICLARSIRKDNKRDHSKRDYQMQRFTEFVNCFEVKHRAIAGANVSQFHSWSRNGQN